MTQEESDMVDRLTQVLKEAERQIVYLHEKFQPTGSGENVLARIRNAIFESESREP